MMERGEWEADVSLYIGLEKGRGHDTKAEALRVACTLSRTPQHMTIRTTVYICREETRITVIDA